MILPNLEEAGKISKGFPRVAVYKKIPAGELTTNDVFLRLKNLSMHCFILESASTDDNGNNERGRYTFIGYNPKLEISCKDGLLTIKNEITQTYNTRNPGEYIAKIIEENKCPKQFGLPPFSGGLAGYFSYDYIKYAEPELDLNAPDIEEFNDADLMSFDKIVAFDHELGEIYIIINIKTDFLEENYNYASMQADALEKVIKDGKRAVMPKLKLTSDWNELFTEQEFCTMVEKAKEYIFEGDIFQVVLSNRLEAKAEGTLFDAYQIMREQNRSPYMFYFSSDKIEIAGASPETLVRLQNGIVNTYPLAGTRPRGLTADEDKALEQDLLSDPKELAEHNMLVDLGRNDVGKISKFGTVEVDKYMIVERFSHVMHIASSVQGEILENKTAVDALSAILPAGTLSGAPKIRACEIINELENCRRGIYGGAIGYIDFTGNMDSCISIRIAFKKNGKIFARSGAGIVADSVPEKEYAECKNKMKSVVNAITQSIEGGIAK
jgi:anthranilate synthase component 1